MSGILGALASVVTAVAAQATARALKRAAWMALAGVLILIGVAFAAAAGYDALVVALGPRTAKLIFAGGFVLVGVIIVVAVSQSGRTHRRAAEPGETTTAAVAFALGVLSGLGRRR